MELKFINFYAQQKPTTHSIYSWLGSTPDAILKLVNCTECKKISSQLQHVIYYFRTIVNIETISKHDTDLYLNIMKNICFDEKIVVEIKVIGKYQWNRNFDSNNILKADGDMYCQLQYEMFLLNCQSSFFIYRRSKSFVVKTISVKFDMNFIKKNLGLVRTFYITRRLPILIYKYQKNKLKLVKYSENLTIQPDINANKSKKKIRKRIKTNLFILNAQDQTVFTKKC